MSLFQSIAVVIFPQDIRNGSPLLRNAISLSQRLSSELHMIVSTADVFKVRTRLNAIKAELEYHGLIFIHPIMGNLLDHLVDELKQCEASFVLLELEPELVDRVKTSALEYSPIPVLLFPPHFILNKRFFYSLLVPMSGEQMANEALDFAIHFGTTAQLPVDLMHVTPEGDKHPCEDQFLEISCDEYYHEYPKKLEQWISQASPFSTSRDKKQVRNLSLHYGDVTHEILAEMKTHERGLLIIEWKGRLAEGSADILKGILRDGNYPLFLVKVRGRESFMLRVGKDFVG